jgi:ABC-type Fe3+ transport system permease subunit
MELRLFRRTSCPIDPTRRRAMRVADLLPLAGFIVPTLVVGYGVVIPRSCIAGFNELTVGFATTILGATITYVLGVRRALQR